MKTRHPAEQIHALESKLRIAGELLAEAKRIDRASRRSLAASAGIPYETLKSAWQNGGMTPDLQAKLGEFCGFDPENPRWCDREVAPPFRNVPDKEYAGRDTVANFRSMLRRDLALGSESNSRIRAEKPILADSNLAVFAVDDAGQAVAAGEATALFLQLMLEPGYHESGIVFGFRKVRIRFQFEAESDATIQRLLGQEHVVEINGAEIRAAGSKFDPYWHLSVPTGYLSGEYTTTSDALCQLVGARLGQPFFAELAVRPADGSLVLPEGHKDLGMEKQRIIQALMATSVSKADSQGWITLGRQKLTIVRADAL